MDPRLSFFSSGLIKKSRPGYERIFLHTPFPSHDIFRIHPKCQELLKGIIGSDLIVFQTYNSLRHFRSSILRTLEIESNLFQLFNHPQQTKIDVGPIGISWESFETTLKKNKFKQSLTSLQQTYKNKHIVLSVERLDYTKGIQRLDAIELFLTKYPKYEIKLPLFK